MLIIPLFSLSLTFSSFFSLLSTYFWLQEQLDVALSKTCKHFDVSHYTKVQLAYTLLGKTQVSGLTCLQGLWGMAKHGWIWWSNCCPDFIWHFVCPSPSQYFRAVCIQLEFSCFLNLKAFLTPLQQKNLPQTGWLNHHKTWKCNLVNSSFSLSWLYLLALVECFHPSEWIQGLLIGVENTLGFPGHACHPLWLSSAYSWSADTHTN